MNMDHAKKTYDLIMANKENYDQSVWHDKKRNEWGDPIGTACNTQHCVAGFAQMLFHGHPDMEIKEGDSVGWDDPFVDAKEYLGLTGYESNWLFSSYRQWWDVERVLTTGKFPWERTE